MRDRCLLHFKHLDAFKEWLDGRGFETRPGVPPYQVLRVRVCDNWEAIYRRASATQHFTVYGKTMNLVRAFLREAGE